MATKHDRTVLHTGHWQKLQYLVHKTLTAGVEATVREASRPPSSGGVSNRVFQVKQAVGRPSASNKNKRLGNKKENGKSKMEYGHLLHHMILMTDVFCVFARCCCCCCCRFELAKLGAGD